MDTILYFAFTAAYILLLVWALAKQKSWNFMSFICLVLIGLIYDNGLIAIGKFIGEGPVLENLSLLRFWSHAFLTPMLVLFSWGALNRAGIGWVKKKSGFSCSDNLCFGIGRNRNCFGNMGIGIGNRRAIWRIAVCIG
ncbi:hypothetical protein FK545_09335 [Planococcus glaciei]|nr:hypothetical protein [Planococcus glaciei]QDY45557.1 hypothetical protein FK545_09335 [Planococcus glaciei]